MLVLIADSESPDDVDLFELSGDDALEKWQVAVSVVKLRSGRYGHGLDDVLKELAALGVSVSRVSFDRLLF